jgi:hypothetical protein
MVLGVSRPPLLSKLTVVGLCRPVIGSISGGKPPSRLVYVPLVGLGGLHEVQRLGVRVAQGVVHRLGGGAGVAGGVGDAEAAAVGGGGEGGHRQVGGDAAGDRHRRLAAGRVELKVMRPSASAPTTTLPLRAVALTAVCSAATSEVESG